MTFAADPAKHWQALAPRQRVEIVLVQVLIAYPSWMYSDYSDAELECVKGIVKDAFHTIAEVRGGKLHSWGGDGGAFMFLIEDGDSFDNACLAAVQMLDMMPVLNQGVGASADLPRAAEARIACDAGMVAYDPNPSSIPGDFAGRFLRHGRHVSVDNQVTITDRVYRQLTRPFKARFVSWKHSPELEVELYCLVPSPESGGPPGPASSSPQRAPGAERPTEPADSASPPEGLPPTGGRLRGLRAYGRPWQKAAVVLGVGLLAGILLGRLSIPAGSPAPPATVNAPAPPWEEFVRSPEWANWRKQIHDRLSATPLTEEALGEALRIKPPGVPKSPAAALRHDQATGDVLLSYGPVKGLLGKRFGIDEKFLGTGLSNPVNVSDYGPASVHEYLIPNARETDPKVLTRKLNPFSLELETKKVKDLIEEATEQDETKQKLKQVIVAHAEANDRGTVMIRFARLDINSPRYKGTLGRPECVRVFASDLTEVWNLKVKDAADRSGYTFSGGDTFFVWVFVPGHPDEAVPATWGHVLDNLPKWMEEAAKKGP
jgi:hypothetical protein